MKKTKHSVMCALLTISIFFLSIPYAISADIPQAKEDKGLVIFYRESSFKGGAIRFNLNQGQEPIGALPSGTMLYRYVEPGQHTFWSQVISKDSVTIDVIAGKTYYIKGVAKIGLLVARPKLTVTTEADAKSAIAKLK